MQDPNRELPENEKESNLSIESNKTDSTYGNTKEFGQDEGDKIFFKHNDIKKDKKRKIYFWIIVVLASILAISSGFILNLLFSPKEESAVSLAIETPGEIYAQQEFDTQLRINNESENELENIYVYFTTNPNITPVEDSVDLTGRGVLISSIDPKSEYALDLTFSAKEVGEEEMKFKIEYNIPGSALIYNSVVSTEVVILDNSLEVEITSEGGESFRSGDTVVLQSLDSPFSGTITVVNNNNAAVTGLSLNIESDDEAVVVSEPADLPLEIPEILADSESETDFEVEFQESGEYDINFTVNNSSQEEVYLSTVTVEILQTDVDITLSANGSQDTLTASLGEGISFTVNALNSGDTDIDDAKIVITTPTVLNLSSLVSLSADPIDGRDIIFSSLKNPKLNNLSTDPPANSIEVDFTLDIVQNLPDTSEEPQFPIKAVLLDSSNDVIAESNTVSLQISSDIELVTNSAFYFRPDNSYPDNYGPFPPVVEKQTSFLVVWELENGLSPTEDTVVSTTLPSGVRFISGDNSAGNLTYNANQRTVTWTVGELEENAGAESDLSAFFTVEIEPTLSDAGQEFPLTLEVDLEAVDTFTDRKIEKQYEGHSSSVPDDLTARTQGINGRVVENSNNSSSDETESENSNDDFISE